MHKCNNPQCGYTINWTGRYKICPKCGYIMKPAKDGGILKKKIPFKVTDDVIDLEAKSGNK